MDSAVRLGEGDAVATLATFGEGGAVKSSPKASAAVGDKKATEVVSRVLSTPVVKFPSFDDLGYPEICDRSPKWLPTIRAGLKIGKIEEIFKHCSALGMHFRPVIRIENGTGRFLCGRDKTLVDKIQVPVYVKVYIVCTQGLNRSQGIHRVAAGQLKPSQLAPPHGAIRGYDPFFTDDVASSDDEGELQEYVDGKIRPVERVERQGKGDDIAKFEATYWLEIIKQGGTIVTVGKSAHAVMYRLFELAERNGLTLEKVHFQPFARTDPYHAKVDREKKVYHYLRAINQLEFRMV